jgi:two-component system sensor histidine kinase MprB
MALRGRLTLMSALIVGVTLVLASIVAYAAVRNQLRGQVDDALRAQAATTLHKIGILQSGGLPRGVKVPPLPPSQGGPGNYIQAVGPDGSVLPLDGAAQFGLTIPVTGQDMAVAAGRGQTFFSNRGSGGSHLRVLTVAVPGTNFALELARPVASVDRVLSRLRVVLLLLCLIGTVIAAALSRAFSRQVIAPVTELTSAAEHIETTGDLSRRIVATGDDEVGSMAARFNAMLDRLQTSQAALSASVETQRRLIADASHELRTPVTSLRTNAEVLRDTPALAEEERRAMLSDVADQAEELGALVADLIELARGHENGAEITDVRLDELVAEAVVRAKRNNPMVHFVTWVEPSTVDGAPDRIGRAVNNLLDNAAKHGPPAGPVEVAVRDGEIAVRDHGPGIEPADTEHLFDRFYRGAGARDRPGSGLGLAIVRQVAEAHGGAVSVENAEGGGALFRLRLPAASAPARRPLDDLPHRGGGHREPDAQAPAIGPGRLDLGVDADDAPARVE